jgi:hypothetical protein
MYAAASGTTEMTIAANPIDVFILRNTVDGTPNQIGLAAPDLARINRLRTPRRQRQMAFRRAALRKLQIARCRMVGHGVTFHSVSMSNNLAVVALGSVRLGVDIECESSRVDFQTILSFVQDASQTQSSGDVGYLPQSARHYDALVAWTEVEAVIKWRGSSLHLMLLEGWGSHLPPNLSTVVFAGSEFACAVAFQKADYLPEIHILSDQEMPHNVQ